MPNARLHSRGCCNNVTSTRNKHPQQAPRFRELACRVVAAAHQDSKVERQVERVERGCGIGIFNMEQLCLCSE